MSKSSTEAGPLAQPTTPEPQPAGVGSPCPKLRLPRPPDGIKPGRILLRAICGPETPARPACQADQADDPSRRRFRNCRPLNAVWQYDKVIVSRAHSLST